MKNISKVYIGVDVSKENLDIYIHPIAKFFKIENKKTAIINFIKNLEKYDIAQIACESTGGFEKLLYQLLQKAKINLWIVDPRRIKGFIVASGRKAKTDKIDAQKIAEFASINISDYIKPYKSQNEETIQSLVNRRMDLVKFLAIEKTRLNHPSHEASIASIKEHIEYLAREIKSIAIQIEDLIREDKELSVKFNLLKSIPGIGSTTAGELLSSASELGTLNNKQISALVGLCPYENESGNYRGKKFIRGGRRAPRNALYMCALTSIKHSLPLKTFYDRLIQKGKPFKVAIVAVMHKLIIYANSILKKGEAWKIDYAMS